jgi:hypothetical protein
MSQPAPTAAETPQKIMLEFLMEAEKISVPGHLREFAGKFVAALPDHLAKQFIVSLGLVNPLYAPDDQSLARFWTGALAQKDFAEMALRLKHAVQAKTAPRILVACPRKSASTFLTKTLTAALGVQEAQLAVSVNQLQASGGLGAAMREHETDELAILRACFQPSGFVAQQHVRFTPYLDAQMRLYQISPIVLRRNLLDSLISMDDMCMTAPQSPNSELFFFYTHLPKIYKTLDPDERMAALIQIYLPWYVQFHASWQKCDRNGGVKPLWLSYEHDIKGEPEALAEKLSAFIGPDRAQVDALVRAIGDRTGQKALKFNQGVTGRGNAISDTNRASVERFVGLYREDLDLTGLLD